MKGNANHSGAVFGCDHRYRGRMADVLSNPQHEVTTPGGVVRGIQRPSGAREYLGIRYASCERLAAPVDVESWTEPLDAFAFGPVCPQLPGTLESMLGSDLTHTAEDCLSLNVYVPGSRSTDSALPVLFWIHGGAYTNGAGSLSWYHGGNLAERGAVVVTINYRLGAFGYLGDSNLGTLDQISALRWVSRNISAFGGDPSNVTIFGESAGGSAVVTLLASPSATGLFSRAWAMSPSIGQLRGRDRAREVLDQFLESAGVSSIDDVASMTVDEILAAQAKVLAIPSDGYDIFAPTAGGPSLPEDILGAAAESPVPFVIGTTRDENKLFAMLAPDASSKTTDDWEALLRQRFGGRAAEAREIYERLRPNETPAALMSAVMTDVGFRHRAQSLAEHRASLGLPTWMYWFTWATPAFGGILGSCHALDIPFAFDNLTAPGADFFTGEGPERRDVADRFSSELIGLATHGHPSWSQFDAVNRDTLVIDAETTLVSDPEREIRALFG